MRNKSFSLVHFLFIVVLAVTFLAAAGCPPRTAPNGEGQKIDFSALTGQWDESRHALILPYPNGRDGCILCHDGYAFAQQIETRAALPEGRRVGEGDNMVAVTSINCAACHTGNALELISSRTVSIPTAANVAGGTGALCMACHNSRRAPSIDDARRSSPHPSAQADVVTGTGGMRINNISVGSTAAHAGVENTCNGCHMPEDPGNFAYHGFTMSEDFIDQTCGGCHRGAATFNLTAGGDYDGDGQKEGFQDEVAGLLALLKDAAGAALNGGGFTSQGGAFVFTDADNNPIENVEPEVYAAAYNWYLVTSDGSLGVHNPTFTIQLLQRTYNALTGENVPNAALK